MALILLLALLLSLNLWVLEPLLQLISHGLELRLLPWLLMAVFGWLLAGQSHQR
jgi:hypothetical protein